MKIVLLITLLCASLLMVSLLQSEETKGSLTSFRVEVAPGEWLRLEQTPGRMSFKCAWQGVDVDWQGDYRDGVDRLLPVSLRTFENGLYLITKEFDKDGDMKLRYWQLDKARLQFKEVTKSHYPRQIATENLLMFPRFMNNSAETDRWKLVRDLDYKHPNFTSTVTANIWADLETGMLVFPLWEQKGMTKEDFLEMFKRFFDKHHPVALPTIVNVDDYKFLLEK
ncbi:MAG: hypothetical protein ACAI34_13625 [Verrucomicrobium sp.]